MSLTTKAGVAHKRDASDNRPTKASRFEWHEIPSVEHMEADYALTASLDPAFARGDRAWWESRTAPQLCLIRAGAWDACERETYAKANYYLALAR